MGLPPPRKDPSVGARGAGVDQERGDDPDPGATEPVAASAWKPRGTDFGPPRSDPEKEEAAQRHKIDAKRRRAVRKSGVMLAVVGGLMFLMGALTAYYTFTIPGLFLASELGIPALVTILLAGIARVLRNGIGDTTLAQATAALPRAAGWAVGIFWTFYTFTTVWQLAVGVAFAVIAFQLYATHDRLRRAGHNGFGPGLRLTLIPLAAYAGWLVLFSLIGAWPLFDPISAAAAFTFVFLMLRESRQTAQAASARHPVTRVMPAAAQTRGSSTKQLLIGVIIGYLFFRFFVAAHIPYGAIVEWFIISLAALFFAIVAAARIGTVPTTRSLPPAHVRTHQQRVWSLPDQHISEVEKHLAAYIHDNKDTDWVRTYYRTLLAASGVPSDQAEEAITGLGKRKSNESERRNRILRLTRLMDDTNGHATGTDSLKTQSGFDGPAKNAPLSPS